MRLSQYVIKTSKDVSQADVSRNAQYLTRAGYVHKLMAGVYSYLPLGNRVLTKIENIIREEMNALGAHEILMPSLQPRENWDTTGRWDGLDVLFQLKGAGDRDLALGPTHEEVVTPLVGSFVQSYRDLPAAMYQIQTKFRNEPRAKSGLLRGREFRMKDLYSFHRTEADLDAFYQRAADAYVRIYERLGLGAITYTTYASGGTFSKYSHEYQTVTEYGEDIIYVVPGTKIAINKEIIDDQEAVANVLATCGLPADTKLEEMKAIEVGNIFKLMTKFSNAFELRYSEQDGTSNEILMGCYGIGSSRVMGTIAECLSDDNGLVWPENIAPYKLHLVSLAQDDETRAAADDLFAKLTAAKIEVVMDDRDGLSAGAKFADADLMGMPYRAVISKKTLAQNGIELKLRSSKDSEIVSVDELIKRLG